METVRDVVFLHNELFFAAAQKKYAPFVSPPSPLSWLLIVGSYVSIY